EASGPTKGRGGRLQIWTRVAHSMRVRGLLVRERASRAGCGRAELTRRSLNPRDPVRRSDRGTVCPFLRNVSSHSNYLVTFEGNHLQPGSRSYTLVHTTHRKREAEDPDLQRYRAGRMYQRPS